MTEKEREYLRKEANVLRLKAILMEHPEKTDELSRLTVQAMTRGQVETFIMEKLMDIREILRYYSPDRVFLSMYINDGYLSIHGSADAKRHLECHVELEDPSTSPGGSAQDDRGGKHAEG